jgi:hypothetical protein
MVLLSWNAAWLDFKFLKRLNQLICWNAAGEFPQPQTGAARRAGYAIPAPLSIQPDIV